MLWLCFIFFRDAAVHVVKVLGHFIGFNPGYLDLAALEVSGEDATIFFLVAFAFSVPA